MAQLELIARVRTEIGGGRPRRLRRLGWIPAILYGGGDDPISLALDQAYLNKTVGRLHENQIISLEVEQDGKKITKPAIVKAIQVDCLAGGIIHVDFHQIALDVELTAMVPVGTTGEPIGVTRDGGILEHILREIEIRCLPADLPETIELDISALEIGETFHVRDVPYLKGIEVLTDPDLSILTIAVPVAEEEIEAEEEEEAEAAAEGEEEAAAEAEGEEKKEERRSD